MGDAKSVWRENIEPTLEGFNKVVKTVENVGKVGTGIYALGKFLEGLRGEGGYGFDPEGSTSKDGNKFADYLNKKDN